MARKDLLASITASLAEDQQAHSPSGARSEYAKRGASRSMMQSLDELAENSIRMLDGETVVSLDPSDLDGSFIADRIGEDDDAYLELREAIRHSGQSTPILVRPHPDDPRRYMIVFGHRRAKVARELGFKVRAIIKPLADIEHVLAQGQENTARADLSFIEKALFARKLMDSGMTKETVKSALTIDDTLLSRMISVVDTVPAIVLEAVGAAKGVGRDRWEELKKLVQITGNAAKAIEFIGSKDFKVGTQEGFNLLLNHIKASKKQKTPKRVVDQGIWIPDDKLVSVTSKPRPKGFSLDLTDKEAKPFGEWISNNLDRLYETFKQSRK
ncbi:plasmid partitioning protein RepB [Phyllobacterium sp. 22229]|uniref:Plasmid partitioning protein RepB n=1 Tax=Phyllobacterium myrsinacearum TaxID=28101 RepID=A0A2S9J9N8_9HYPH|nr:plasmid partitioning protein RepB [Phyllobacterium myrsinacearum]PRD49492.1 plasmid partitioning protein RepB [Phyllobacterium myrsinacearum]PWV83507.1 ParB family chromosome partitioning protein [Phyllobacterium myrsinacearum]RZS70590.1 ParB family chromosome partitioning protein [Phyllobacterium myrsinacearum]RZU96757.1 ParB family chromosome partitioning protein [Phyllobacterium myrsinacearum]